MFKCENDLIYIPDEEEDKIFINSLLSSYKFSKKFKNYIHTVVKENDTKNIIFVFHSSELKEEDFNCLKKNKYFINFCNGEKCEEYILTKEIWTIYMKPIEENT